MKIRRIPIALRLFLFVSLGTVLITTISLISQHRNMQKNFAHYVADVEMQKLDHLVNSLQHIYELYGDWGNAIQDQILQVEGQPDPDDYDQLSRWWLKRQYDIALQQTLIKEYSVKQLAGRNRETGKKSIELDDEEVKLLQANYPSEYRPFEGLTFPLRDSLRWRHGRPPIPPVLNAPPPLLAPVPATSKVEQDTATSLPTTGKTPTTSATQTTPAMTSDTGTAEMATTETADESLKDKPLNALIFMPDRLGLSSRLALYDAKWQFIVGNPSATEGDVSYRILEVDDKVVGYLALKATLEQDDALSINFFSNQERYLLLIYALAIGSSLLIALLLATYFKNPIQRLLVATQELSKGNYQHQVHIKRNDELGDLSNHVNQLAEILHQHEQSRRQWVADTSHELKTPLSVLQAQIEAMQDGIRKPSAEHFDAMQRQVQSLKKLTQDLADLAQADVQQLSCYPSEVSVWQVVQQEVMHFQPKFEHAQLTVETEGVDALAWVDIDRFKQIIVNLLQNSIRYTTAGGKIHVHSHIEGKDWVLYIDDSPLGVDDEQLARLGERFYRVDDSRTRATGGTGLGLALSCKIATTLGGSLTFAHSPLGGLRCRVALPIYTPTDPASH